MPAVTQEQVCRMTYRCDPRALHPNRKAGAPALASCLPCRLRVASWLVAPAAPGGWQEAQVCVPEAQPGAPGSSCVPGTEPGHLQPSSSSEAASAALRMLSVVPHVIPGQGGGRVPRECQAQGWSWHLCPDPAVRGRGAPMSSE